MLPNFNPLAHCYLCFWKSLSNSRYDYFLANSFQLELLHILLVVSKIICLVLCFYFVRQSNRNEFVIVLSLATVLVFLFLLLPNLYNRLAIWFYTCVIIDSLRVSRSSHKFHFFNISIHSASIF